MDGLFLCISVVFWCLASKAVSLTGDLDKSGELLAPYWALQEMGHGKARYSMGWGLNCTLCELYQWDRQSGDVHLINNNTSLSALFRPQPFTPRSRAPFAFQTKHSKHLSSISDRPSPSSKHTCQNTSSPSSPPSHAINHSPKTTRHLPKTPDRQPDWRLSPHQTGSAETASVHSHSVPWCNSRKCAQAGHRRRRCRRSSFGSGKCNRRTWLGRRVRRWSRWYSRSWRRGRCR